MTRKIKFLSAMVALLLGLTLSAFGQERAGSIEGTITDPQGGVVPGASVTITGINVGFSRTVTSDDSGFFRVLEVPPGTYRVAIGATGGFGANERSDVVVTLGKATPVNFTLAAAAVGATVEVTQSDTAAIDPTDSKIQTNITERTIELVPKGTNFTSVLNVSPATRNEPLSGGFQVDGASGSENTFIVDGQEVTNFRTGTLNINNNIPFQLVQEVQVKSNGFEAEFGGATGGVINVATKGGTNSFNGEAGIQFEPSKLFSRPRQILEANETRLNYIQPQRERFTYIFPTASLGGPIIKDRLWFFSSYNVQSLTTKRSFVFANGTAGTYRSTDRRDYGFVRLDGNVTNNLRLNGTYLYNPLRRHGVLPAFTTLFASPGVASLTPESQSIRGGRQPATNVTGSAVYTPNSRIVLSVRAGRGYLNEKLSNYGIPQQLRTVCQGTGNANLPGVTPAGRCSPGFNSIPTNSLTVKDISIRQTVDADASFLVSNFLGRHEFKGGYQLNRISNDVQSGNVGLGTLVLRFGQTFPDAEGRPRGGGAGELGYGFLQQFGEFGKVSSKNEGIYIQDTWQPTSRLSLNLGVRAERENVPPFNTGPGLQFNFTDKIAPRLGVAYDVTGTGRFKVFASYGQFYDRFKYELPRGSFGGNIFTNDYFVITDPNYTAYTFENAISRRFLQLNFRVPANQVEPITIPGLGTFTNLIDPDLKPVRQTEFTVGTEYGLTRDLVLAARYTRKSVDRTIEDVGVPDPTGNETYFIANPGFGLVGKSLIPGVPATPKAKRQYDAVEFRADKRFANRYFLNASYTYSRLFGNYGGLASSDEDGRTSPNVTRAFDLPFEAFTTGGEPNTGRLATDRPHVFKFFGGYELGWFGSRTNSTELFVSTTAQSGTPLTTNIDILDVEVVAFRRGDLGRTEPFTQTDFGFTHRYRFGIEQRYSLVFEANILNLFNEANELDRYTLASSAIYGPSELIFGERAFTEGREATRTQGIAAIFQSGGVTNNITSLLGKQITIRNPNGTTSVITPFPNDRRFNNPNRFQGVREVRFGFRFQF